MGRKRGMRGEEGEAAAVWGCCSCRQDAPLRRPGEGSGEKAMEVEEEEEPRRVLMGGEEENS